MAESFENLDTILRDWATGKVQEILVEALNRYEKQTEGPTKKGPITSHENTLYHPQHSAMARSGVKFMYTCTCTCSLLSLLLYLVLLSSLAIWLRTALVLEAFL